MSANQNVHLIGRFHNEMWNQFDKGLFPELLAEDIRFRGSLGQSAVGYGEFGQYVDYIPSDSLNPTARFFGSSTAYMTLTARPSS